MYPPAFSYALLSSVQGEVAGGRGRAGDREGGSGPNPPRGGLVPVLPGGASQVAISLPGASARPVLTHKIGDTTVPYTAFPFITGKGFQLYNGNSYATPRDA